MLADKGEEAGSGFRSTRGSFMALSWSVSITEGKIGLRYLPTPRGKTRCTPGYVPLPSLRGPVRSATSRTAS